MAQNKQDIAAQEAFELLEQTGTLPASFIESVLGKPMISVSPWVFPWIEPVTTAIDPVTNDPISETKTATESRDSVAAEDPANP